MTGGAGSGGAITQRHAPHALSLAASIVLLAAAIRIMLLSGEFYALHGDEAQYWVWAQEPAFGYYSKPPMIAWIIWVTTTIFGDREFGVRMAAPLFHAGTALLIYGIGHRLFDRRTGFWASITYALLPGVSLSAMVMSTDVPLLFFWALGIYWLVRALDDDAWRSWLWLGLAFGLGLLSRYTMALFPVSMALYALVADRKLLARRRLWTGLALGLLIYLPNLAWNAQHGFATYRHTEDNANLGGELFNPNKLLDFLGAQFAVFGPFLFAVLAVLLARLRWQVADERRWLLASFIWPQFLVACVVAFLSRANANWAAAIYVTGSVLVAAWAFERRDGAGWRARWRAWIVIGSAGLHALLAVIGYSYHDIARVAGIEITRKIDPAKRITGNREIGTAVARLLRDRPTTVLMTDDRMLFGVLAFYVRPRPTQVQWNPDGRIGNHFELTTHIEDYANADILYVTRKERPDALARFTDVEAEGTITLPVYRDSTLVYHLFDLHGLKR